MATFNAQWWLTGAFLLSIGGCSSPNVGAAVPVGQDAMSSVLTDTATRTDAREPTLEERIRNLFPGYRLSTEDEVLTATRINYLDLDPSHLWRPEEFGEDPSTGPWVGSGRQWWVWEGDFRGQGERDVLTLLSEDRPDARAASRMVILHADGTTFEEGYSGSGIRITRKGTTLRGETLESDAFAIVFWEKAADMYVWNAGTRDYQELAAACC
ncbi:MAG: hypothetical protein H0U67_09515 [Gemmatimonadetes bacterium]|nr:hypothetical protein [Gemmatimonadota bacterium]